MSLPSGRPSSFLSGIYPLLLVLGVALVLRLLWVSRFHPVPSGDFLDVHIEASFYAAGHPAPSNYQAPGYPFLVSMLYRLYGANYRVVHYLNICLGILSCFLIYRLGQKIFTRHVGLAAALLGALHPGLSGLCSLLAYENLLIPLLLAGTISLIKEDDQNTLTGFLPAGVLWASAALVRPTVLLFPFYLLLVYFRKYHRNKLYRKILGISLITILFMAGWVGSNYKTSRHAKVIRQAGIALWLGNNHTPYLGTGPKPRNLSTNVFMDWRDRRYLKRAVWEIYSHPFQFMGKMIMKVENLYLNYGTGFSFPVQENYYEHLFQERYYSQAYYLDPFFRLFGYFLVAALLIFLAESSSRGQPAGLLLHFILYWTLVHAVFFARIRFRIVIDPFLVIFAAVVVLRLWNRFSKGRYWSPEI